MIEFSQIRVGEIAKIVSESSSTVSKKLKSFSFNDNFLRKSKYGKILGISPEAASMYLLKNGITLFQKGSIILSGNICSDIGKTTSILYLGIALSKISGKDSPIIFVDTDHNFNLTLMLNQEAALNNEFVLKDFLAGDVSIEKILTKIGKNIWLIKSNISNGLINEIVENSVDIKEKMLFFYNELFRIFGKNVKILQDNSSQLSKCFNSSICGLYQMQDISLLKVVLIPICDKKHSLFGAKYIINEIKKLKKIFNFKSSVKINCFFSIIDNMLDARQETLHIIKTCNEIAQNLSTSVIKSHLNKNNCLFCKSSIVDIKLKSKYFEDYQRFLIEIFK